MTHSDSKIGSVTRFRIESHKLHQQGHQATVAATDTTRAIETAVVDLAAMDIESAFVKLRAMTSMLKNEPGHNVVAFPTARAKQTERALPLGLAAAE